MTSKVGTIFTAAAGSTTVSTTPANASATPTTTRAVGRSPSRGQASRSVKGVESWLATPDTLASPWPSPTKTSPKLRPPKKIEMTIIGPISRRVGSPTNGSRIAATTMKRRPTKNSGGNAARPSLMTTNCTPQHSGTSTAQAIWSRGHRNLFHDRMVHK